MILQPSWFVLETRYTTVGVVNFWTQGYLDSFTHLILLPTAVNPEPTP